MDTKDYKKFINDLTNQNNYIWEIISDIGSNIKHFKNESFLQKENHVFIHMNAVVDEKATIIGPAIIGEGTIIKPGAYIRENVIVGKDCVIGSSVEIKNSILFDGAKCAHQSYIGDSVIGNNVNIGSGTKLSNFKLDHSTVKVELDGKIIDTHLVKLGSMISPNVDIGCNSVLCPGTIVGENTLIYPLNIVKGSIPSNSIIKEKNNIVKRK